MTLLANFLICDKLGNILHEYHYSAFPRHVFFYIVFVFLWNPCKSICWSSIGRIEHSYALGLGSLCKECVCS